MAYIQEMRKIFLTYFPNYSDIHLFKDPGQIPYRFKKALGFDGYIITSEKNENVKETEKFLKILYLPHNRISRYFKLLSFFFKNRESIQIFNIFHIGFHNIFVAFLCKLIVPHVFIYLKMDNCMYTGPYLWEKIFDPQIKPASFYPEEKKANIKQKIKKYLLKNYLIKKVDLFSVEDDDSRRYYEDNYPFFNKKIITVYNGHTIDLILNNDKMNSIYRKENIILNVARLGTFPKATEILLESFAKISETFDWELHLAGSVEEKFKPYLSEYFQRYPALKSRIYFHGHLEKINLFKLYQRAKIFCLP